jgi:hypothetical protein
MRLFPRFLLMVYDAGAALIVLLRLLGGIGLGRLLTQALDLRVFGFNRFGFNQQP